MKKSEILNILNYIENGSNCTKRHVAACLVDNLNHVQLVGYNNICLPLGNHICKTCKSGIEVKMCPAIHAEIDCLNKISRDEIIMRGLTTMFVSYSPCPECCKAIRVAGIKRVIVKEPRLKPVDPITADIYSVNYFDELSQKLLDGIEYIRLWETPSNWEYFTKACWEREAS